MMLEAERRARDVRMSAQDLVQRVWYGADALAVGARASRCCRAERMFGGVVGARDILYDAGWLPAHDDGDPGGEHRESRPSAERARRRSRHGSRGARGARCAAGRRFFAVTAMTSRSCIAR